MATNGFAGAAWGLSFPSTGSGSAGANSMYLTQVTLIRTATVVAVLLAATANASGISIKGVVYDSAHSALLTSGASASTSVAIGYNRLAVSSVSLAAGTYYVGYVCNTAFNVAVDSTQTGTSWWVSGGQSVTTPANPLVGGSSQNSGLLVALEFDGSTANPYGFAPDYTNGVTLNADGSVATMTTVAQLARSVVTQSQATGGKFYAEVKPSIVTNTVVGLVSANVRINTPNAAWTYPMSEGYTPSGTLIGTATASGLPTWTAGSTIGIAYDAGNKLVWFRVNNGAWWGTAAGDPVAGTNGANVTYGTNLNNWPICLGATANGTAATFTLQDYAAAFQFTPPSGYSAWSPYVAAASASQARVMVMA